MGVFQNNLMGAAAAAAAGGGDFYTHQIDNSVRVSNSSANSTATNYLYRDGGSGNRDTWTLGMWIKRARISTSDSHTSMSTWGGHSGSGSARGYGMVNDYTGTINGMSFENNNGSSWHLTTRTNAMYKDTSGWTHVCWRYDSTQATEADRARMYVNGELITDLQSTTYPAQNADHSWNSGGYQFIGTNGTGTNGNNPYQGFDGYIAEVINIDGTSLDPMDNLVETKNGVIIPKDPSGLTFGSEGFHLKFESSSDLGNDSSGNNNDFTVVGIAAHDQMIDTPTFDSSSNGGNFCTYNPIVAQGGAQKLMTLSEGNLHAQSETNDKYHQIIGTHGVKTGKWYIEWYIEAAGYPSWAVGWRHGSQLELYDGGTQSGNANLAYVGYFTGSNVYIKAFGSTATADPQVAYSGWTSAGDAPTTGDVMMCAIDMDAGKVWWGFNGEWGDVGSGTGNPATGANASNTWTVANYTDHIFPFTLSWANPDAEIIMNCGQDGTFAGHITAGGNADDTGYGNFKYDVPAGFLSLCTGNLPVVDEVDPAQTDDNYPQELFFMSRYTGNLTGRTITTENQPDLIVNRMSNYSQNWYVVDSTRVITDNKYITFDTTGAEATFPQSNFTSVGATSVGISAGTWLNSTGSNYQMWMWRANGGTTSTNSNGSTDSTVQVDPSGHFSIVKFEGQNDSWGNAETIGHGLSSAPTCMILKNYDKTDQWSVFFSDYGSYSIGGSNAACNELVLNTDAALYTNQSYKGWGGVMPTSTVFTVDGNNNNGASESIIVYCFANCEGYIKSGTYVGNADADGTFVYTGFKPAFVMNKPLVQGNWRLVDNARSTYNVTQNALSPNNNDAKDTYDSVRIDLLSNGFKMRDSQTPMNQATTYVYLAFAENPFKYATAR